jgi:hypothetical protein
MCDKQLFPKKLLISRVRLDFDLFLGSENEDDERRGKENEENVKRRRSTKRKASKTTGEIYIQIRITLE